MGFFSVSQTRQQPTNTGKSKPIHLRLICTEGSTQILSMVLQRFRRQRNMRHAEVRSCHVRLCSHRSTFKLDMLGQSAKGPESPSQNYKGKLQYGIPPIFGKLIFHSVSSILAFSFCTRRVKERQVFPYCNCDDYLG
jgi:hypothetical protein